ncbi:HTH domain-containing protein [Bifidobacterium moukalabense]|uniref:HTH domain-containing protein n=1 Tax=Bifidobacterium moukalabense TaxID=1333651 RepID=UPI0010F4F106|nr:HTH domain-containing protein [Bifidobacterium moukalabense]
MTRKTFTDEEAAILRTSPAVLRATSRRITYAAWFRRYAVIMNRRGERPSDIFRGVGLDPKIVGHKRIERCMNRWRTDFADVDFSQRDADRLLEHADESDPGRILESLDRMNDQLDCITACVNVVIDHTRDVIDSMDITCKAMMAAKQQSVRLRDAIQADRPGAIIERKP